MCSSASFLHQPFQVKSFHHLRSVYRSANSNQLLLSPPLLQLSRPILCSCLQFKPTFIKILVVYSPHPVRRGSLFATSEPRRNKPKNYYDSRLSPFPIFAERSEFENKHSFVLPNEFAKVSAVYEHAVSNIGIEISIIFSIDQILKDQSAK